MESKIIEEFQIFIEEDFEVSVNSIKARLAEFGFDQKLSILEEMYAANQYQRIFYKFMAALFCFDNKKIDEALIIYKSIVEEFDEYKLEKWVPKFILFVLEKYYRILDKQDQMGEKEKIYKKILSLSPKKGIELNRGENYA